MTLTAPTAAPSANSFLQPGVEVSIRDVRYLITATKPKNYGIHRIDNGKNYNIDRRAPLVVIGPNAEAFAKFLSSQATPTLTPGTKVRVTSPGRFNGTVGIILRANAKRYSIMVDGVDGHLMVPFSHVAIAE